MKSIIWTQYIPVSKFNVVCELFYGDKATNDLTNKHTIMMRKLEDVKSVSFDQNCLRLTFSINHTKAVNPTSVYMVLFMF